MRPVALISERVGVTFGSRSTLRLPRRLGVAGWVFLGCASLSLLPTVSWAAAQNQSRWRRVATAVTIPFRPWARRHVAENRPSDAPGDWRRASNEHELKKTGVRPIVSADESELAIVQMATAARDTLHARSVVALEPVDQDAITHHLDDRQIFNTLERKNRQSAKILGTLQAAAILLPIIAITTSYAGYELVPTLTMLAEAVVGAFTFRSGRENVITHAEIERLQERRDNIEHKYGGRVPSPITLAAAHKFIDLLQENLSPDGQDVLVKFIRNHPETALQAAEIVSKVGTETEHIDRYDAAYEQMDLPDLTHTWLETIDTNRLDDGDKLLDFIKMRLQI